MLILHDFALLYLNFFFSFYVAFIHLFILFFHSLSIPPTCMSSSLFVFRFVSLSSFYKRRRNSGRNKDMMMTKSNFSTWDPRKLGKPGTADPLGPQYDEIPYGDVAPPHIAGTGRGILPEVPAEYAQVPMVPARMGKKTLADSDKKCLYLYFDFFFLQLKSTTERI